MGKFMIDEVMRQDVREIHLIRRCLISIPNNNDNNAKT